MKVICNFVTYFLQGKFNKYYAEESWRRILPNTTHLIGNFVNLELGITYLIKYALRIAESTVYSNWHTVQTDCIRKKILIKIIFYIMFFKYNF